MTAKIVYETILSTDPLGAPAVQSRQYTKCILSRQMIIG